MGSGLPRHVSDGAHDWRQVLIGLPDTLASSYRKFGYAGEKASTGFIGGIIDSDIKWTPPRKTSRVLVFMQPDKRLYVLS
jgi:hypothetical protein